MPLIPTDPSSWSLDMYRVFNYFVVLTFGQEYELIWKQRRSFMTALYIVVRYFGILYSVINLPGALTTDTVSYVMDLALLWATFPINGTLTVIMIFRLHAMYQRSRKILIFLIATFVSVTIFCVAIAVSGTSLLSIKVFLYGSQCVYEIDANQQLRMLETYAVATAWEALTLGLAIWIVVKHLRELRTQSTGQTVIGDLFTVLLKTHALYFIFFTVSSSLNIGLMSPYFSALTSVGAQSYRGILELSTLLQMFVAGPRLILSVRGYHAKFMPNFEEGTTIYSMAFREYIPESTDSDV
ncbi:uncharacterized protein F5147DRAFT_668099 [Suillus discolor]|uniref:DUF6533 domain-containing protein n=1 Tax=Suillus discolor TaxID=1912936 RepID=A0A9P7K053_9AGAM|nr:uncharacterized protein F5147DRAFT_668099 [Suillus discolor]KAG2119077.1 hypothetical protein F5147DRAFT_668099 [Suillus discolor]